MRKQLLSTLALLCLTVTSAWADDVISGVFSVSATKKVCFAKGNLTRTSGKWALLSNSWEYNTAAATDNKVNTDDGAQHFQWRTVFNSASSGESDVVDDITTDLGSGWHALSPTEWRYLLGYDSNNSGVQSSKRTVQWHYYAKITGATVGTSDKRYLLIFPDDFKGSDWNASTMGTAPTVFDAGNDNSISPYYTAGNFTAMQSAGIVILPATGYYYSGTSSSSWLFVGTDGFYWSRTSKSSESAYDMSFFKTNVRMETFTKTEEYFPVRLVKEYDGEASLTDGDDLSALSAYTGKVCKVNYTRSFTADKPSTVCLPFAYTKGAVGTFYTFTGITKSGSEYIATMTEYTGANLVANTPYLFYPSATGAVDFSGTYTLPASIEAGTTTSGDWTFVGTYTEQKWTSAPTGIYGFSAQSVDAQGISQGEFVKVGAYVRIKPMRCYLKYKNGSEDYAAARALAPRRASAVDNETLPETIKVRLISADGNVTGIATLNTHTGEVTADTDGWYDLSGCRLNSKPIVSGIYVNNGKKVVIK